MKLFNKYMFVALAAVAGLTACSDDDNYVAGEQDSANKAGVYFISGQATSTELAPEEETSLTIELARKNTTGAVTVPLTVEGSADIFTVTDAVFADGDSTTTATVSFPNAEIGTTYTFTVTVPDEYVAIYKTYGGTNAGYQYTASVIRVQWNELGTVQFYDGFWYGVLFDNVKLQQRNDKPSVYRITNPYTDEFVTSMEETPSGYYSEYFSFTVDNDDYISWDNYFPYNTYNSSYGAAMLGWYPSALSSSIAANDENSKVQRDADGNVIYYELQPYWYMSGVGGYGCYPLIIGAPGVDLNQYLSE